MREFTTIKQGISASRNKKRKEKKNEKRRD
jgi:hypothetical protein